MAAILIIVDSERALELVEKGLGSLKELAISFHLRLSSPLLDMDHLQSIVSDFEKSGGQVIISFAGAGAGSHFPIAAMTELPVIAASFTNLDSNEFYSFPIENAIPLAHLGYGVTGFASACGFAARLLAMEDLQLRRKLKIAKSRSAALLVESDAERALIFPQE